MVGSELSLTEWVARARREFPPIPGPSPVNLVCSHDRRVAINRDLMEVFKPRGAIYVNPGRPSNARKNRPQPMWLWVSQRVLCAVRCNGLRNAWPYVIEKLTDSEAWLRPEGGKDVVKYPHARVVERFRPSFAMTYHASQGLGFDRVRLWDCESQCYCLQKLFTGMSRCTRSDGLDFGVMK
jgi:hypothetical protein